MSVKDIIVRIRSSTHDKKETGYQDSDLVGYINDAIRMIRRIVLDIRPELLSHTVTGTLLPGKADIQSESVITKVISVRANGEKLKSVPASMVIDAEAVGEPRMFYLPGWKTLRLYPIPEKETAYSATVVSDMEIIDSSGSSPFPMDMDDFIVEYVITRASMSNEFDVSQESSIMGNIISQVMSLVRNITPDTVDVRGYWYSPRRG